MNCRRHIVALLACAASAAALAQDPAPGEAPRNQLPDITTVRYVEDYSFLRHHRADNANPLSLVPLKHIPLGDDSYLTLGNELRVRYEFYNDNQWGQGPQDDGGYVWLRVLPYADLRVGESFRAFGQLVAAFEWGDETGVSPPDEDRLDVLQVFVDFRLPIDAQGDFSVLVRAGRQLMRYGSERLIGVRYGPNVLQPFDAALIRLDTGPWRIDALYGRPVEIDRGEWDDQTDNSRSVWAAYATGKLSVLGEGAGIDAYYIGYTNDQAEFVQGAGEELRHTLGVRVSGSRNALDWDLEAFYQFGDFDTAGGNGRINAWSLASNLGYTFERVAFRPRLGLKANVISGDDDPNDRDLQTFNPLFPKGQYFGEIGLLGPYNLINVHPSLTLHLTDKMTLDLATVFYWRQSTSDGIYDNAGNLLRSAAQSDATFIGTQAEVLLSYNFTREIEASAAYGVFFPGRFIHETGDDEVVHFIGVEITYRF